MLPRHLNETDLRELGTFNCSFDHISKRLKISIREMTGFLISLIHQISKYFVLYIYIYIFGAY